MVPITSVGEISLELCLTSGGAIADLFVLADGDPVPDWVQRWKPMWDKADMLLVSTHADDELLWFGGAMPVYAGQFQKKVQVAYVTNHGPQRTHELLDGLWTVGVVAYPMISSFPDRYCKTFQQALEKYDENAVLEYQVSLLRRFKPDVVLGRISTASTDTAFISSIPIPCARRWRSAMIPPFFRSWRRNTVSGRSKNAICTCTKRIGC